MKQARRSAVLLSTAFAVLLLASLRAQITASQALVLVAEAKGPDQINLTWPALRGSFYGFLVEIRSSNDDRYSEWTELQPIPTGSGYTCDSTVVLSGATCNISDPAGAHVYNPVSHAVPYWVTDANYIDPQDDSRAQFIVGSLKPATEYDFRVRTYAGGAVPQFGSYSNTASATTARYELRYVSPAGNDSNDGLSPDPAHAWRTIYQGSVSLGCGQALIVIGGSYANDGITMEQSCPADNKAVIMANPGETVTLTSMGSVGIYHPILLLGTHIVIDGVHVVSTDPVADYDIEVDGTRNALINVEAHPPLVPSTKAGVFVQGSNTLIYRSSFHDYGSPDAVQNPNGNGGFVLTVFGESATDNVIWSNHLTRGGHDVSLCKAGCSFNRWLNNIMDGGWGMGFNSINGGSTSDYNLIEGNVMKDVGSLVQFYKPAIQISSSYNTVRRNVTVGGASWGLEESALDGNARQNLIYNNVVYASGGCIFQSANGGSVAYDHSRYSNNICYNFSGLATDIYPGNTNSIISKNTFLYFDDAGNPVPSQPIVIWNHSAGDPWDNPKPLDYADRSYSPPFVGNKGLDLKPQFVSEAAMDFHLAASSPLINAGDIVKDTEWGTAEGSVDLGAYGLHLPKNLPRYRLMGPGR